MQAMQSSKLAAIEKEIEESRKQGHGTYYGESVELLANLQMQPAQTG